MTCDQAIELLPWLVNGTLEAEDRNEVRQHLKTCERCRTALADTLETLRLFDQHLPAQALVSLAWGETPADVDPALAELHLASCPQCAAEMELTRTSRRLEEDDRIAVFPLKTKERTRQGESRTWRTAAIAASLVGVVALSGWLHSARQLQPLEARNQQIQREQEALVAQQKENQAELARIAALAKGEPQLNTWADDVFAQDVVRGTQEQEEIVIPAGVPATPILEANAEVADPLRRIEIVDETGKVRFNKEGLRRHPEDSSFTLTFQPGFLEPGRYTIRLYTPDGTPRETYTIRVQ
jgi:anti-sigma factor RsiW